MKKTLIIVAAVVMALVIGAEELANAQSNPCNPCGKKESVFHVNDPMSRNSITFKSEAPLEDIVGTSNQVTGRIVFDPRQPDKGGFAQLTVPVASFNTGIPMRDEHLQGADWLDAAQYGDVTLRINTITNFKEVKSTATYVTYDVDVDGELSLHGITRAVAFPARITYLQETEKTRAKLAGDLLAARASFEVRLSDYGITGPAGADLIGSKVGETIEIDVSLMGSTASASVAANPCGDKAAMAHNPCNPCGGKAGKSGAENPCNPCGGKK
jgi:polyisoprenoid-binding protein YceI